MKVAPKINCQPLHAKNQVAFTAKANNAAKMDMAQKAHKGKLDVQA